MGTAPGFFAGLLVSVFSKTLVLLAGISMLVIQVSSLKFSLTIFASRQNPQFKSAPLNMIITLTSTDRLQVAARNGIDLVAILKLKERASTSRILAMLDQHTAFKLSFSVAFALSAFMSF